MTNPLVLVVDDERDIRELLKITLGRMNIDVVDVEDLASAKRALGQRLFSLCLTDMRLPDGNGIDLVEYMQQSFPDVPVAVITAYGNMELAVTALKAGAFDFVSKPVDLKILRELVHTALKLSERVAKVISPQPRYLLGTSPAIETLRNKISKLARSQAPVCITGASGVGKELVARLIHELGPRSGKSFIPVNCGAIPSELMESEFFGYKKGSFTGAVADKEGLFHAAQGGTLFLDEVDELPLTMQVKLLRVIQEKAVRPIGAPRELAVDVRILSATHRDLHELVKAGIFRQDLFYRINVIELQVPSLSERPEDISLLANHILTQLAEQQGIAKPELSSESLVALGAYAFPGNIRELENILERALTLCENNVIEPKDLQLDDPDIEEGLTADQSLESYLDDVAKETILAALEKYRWNKAMAAKELRISLRALRYRMRRLGLVEK